MNVGSLFSGIGGLDLGLERAGMSVVWQSEIDPYASRVLAKHWPDVPNLGDITTIDWSSVEPVDLICGGYPCQPFSLAGVRQGGDDPRHLWPHFHRAIRDLRPRLALLENVSGHLSLGFDRVLGDLAEIGYDVEWCSVPAAAVGAPHLRWRIFAIAYPKRDELRQQPIPIFGISSAAESRDDGAARAVADPDGCGQPRHEETQRSGREVHAGQQRLADTERRGAALADPDSASRSEPRRAGEAVLGSGSVERSRRRSGGDGGAWAVEPDVGRVAHGVPARVDRLRCLGNAVVPQVAEWIGRQIMAVG